MLDWPGRRYRESLFQSRARLDRLDFPDRPAHLIQPDGDQFLRVKGRPAREQFIE
jgi:hypothetical protein